MLSIAFDYRYLDCYYWYYSNTTATKSSGVIIPTITIAIFLFSQRIYALLNPRKLITHHRPPIHLVPDHHRVCLSPPLRW